LAPDPTGGVYSVPLDLAVFRGPLLLSGGGVEGKRRDGTKREGTKGGGES